MRYEPHCGDDCPDTLMIMLPRFIVTAEQSTFVPGLHP
jgi:hypothetical protein